MQLFESWLNSLSLFKPKSISLFLLVTLNAIIKTFQALFRNFWWLIVLYIVGDLAIEHAALKLHASSIAIGGIAFRMNSFLWIVELGFLLMLFTVLLCARPSLEPKKAFYSAKYWKKFFYFVLISSIFSFIVGERFGMEVDDVTGAISQFIPMSLNILRSLLLLDPAIVVSPLFVFIAMFMVDGDGSLKSFGLALVRGFKMCLYNYPFCLISMLVLHYIWQAWDILIFGLLSYFQVPIVSFINDGYSVLPAFSMIKYAAILFWPIPLCYWINFYIKRMHEQFDLYFQR
jgi:hypothetical protein